MTERKSQKRQGKGNNSRTFTEGTGKTNII